MKRSAGILLLLFFTPLGAASCSLLVSTSGLEDQSADAGGVDAALTEASTTTSDAGDSSSANPDVLSNPDAPPLPFCAAHASAVFCEDFETAAQFARWRPPTTTVGTQVLDTLVFHGGAQALHTELPILATNEQRFSGTPFQNKVVKTVHFEAAINIDSPNETVAPIVLSLQDSATYSELTIAMSNADVHLIQYLADCGQADCSIRHPVFANTYKDRWTSIAIDVDLPPTSKVTFTVDGAVAVYPLSNSKVVPGDVKVHVEAGLWGIAGKTTANVKSFVDDVVLDAK